MESCLRHSFHGSSDKEFLLFGALVMEHFWFARNQIVHKGIKFCPNKNLQIILKKFNEYHSVLSDVPLMPPRPIVSSWYRPEQGAIKINCDAAVGLDHSFISIVATDWGGFLIFSISKQVETNLPIQVEAKTVNLAPCLAIELGFENVVVESDAKACIETLKAFSDVVPWRISTIVADTLFGHPMVNNLYLGGVQENQTKQPMF